jgi:dolichol-phosphate mannosyltransferase
VASAILTDDLLLSLVATGAVFGYERNMASVSTCELVVVMPIFNEADCLGAVLEEWTAVLDRTGIAWRLLALDDGSTDDTPSVLSSWLVRLGPERMEVLRHANRGHGRSCLRGYLRACELGVPWVMQIDSDGQCDASFFAPVWSARDTADVVYGVRRRRLDGWRRVLASALVRLLVRARSGVDCPDANVPYRLMRTAGLPGVLATIHGDFDLANIALAVQLRRAEWREACVDIVFRPRASGEPSVPLHRFAVKAAELAVQLGRLPAPAAAPRAG